MDIISNILQLQEDVMQSAKKDLPVVEELKEELENRKQQGLPYNHIEEKIEELSH